MGEYSHKSHHVTVLLYHLAFPAKYRRAVLDAAIDAVLRAVCLKIEQRYEIKFIELGVDKDHVPFLVQSVPTYGVTLVTRLKRLTARAVFKRCPQVKQKLWGGEFWHDGYVASTVGKHGDEGMIARSRQEPGQRLSQVTQR
ncbi:MAG: IS200/IS605 family transposase [Verrucomicrobia bacterium]|nr:IS200/IS605 family transposase [Leptolyngbya sp. ES-bin-22]